MLSCIQSKRIQTAACHTTIFRAVASDITLRFHADYVRFRAEAGPELPGTCRFGSLLSPRPWLHDVTDQGKMPPPLDCSRLWAANDVIGLPTTNPPSAASFHVQFNAFLHFTPPSQFSVSSIVPHNHSCQHGLRMHLLSHHRSARPYPRPHGSGRADDSGIAPS